MKIEPNGYLSMYALKSKNASSVDPNDLKKEEASSTNEENRLEKEANELAELMKLLPKEEMIREDKLRDLREKIESGTYQITGKDVVRKMLGDE